ncbi:hypothetical protein COLO4_03776 [Corchorus olitorius]|uniref:Uncharacterized protein n=1 Tax=Corchorus olitorius TaxID=93759 RepID=A0A1R3KWY4_9ROSI|nr:hypothetical protein COLO4_03776 [Corchorus olitorius]
MGGGKIQMTQDCKESKKGPVLISRGTADMDQWNEGLETWG